MKFKLLSMFLLSAIFAMTIISAAGLTVSKNVLTFSNPEVTQSFTITPTINDSIEDNASYTVTVSEAILDEDGNEIALTITGALTEIDSAATVEINASVDYDTLKFGRTYTGELLVEDINNENETATVDIEIKPTYCTSGCNNDDMLKIDVDISNKEGYGEEDYEWYALDEIEFEITVENLDDDTIDDIIIEWCLYSVEDDKCDAKDEESNFKLKEDDEKEVIITYTVDPDDVDKGGDDYILFVKVYSDDKDYGEEVLCDEYSEEITIMIDDNFVIVGDVVFTETVACEDNLEIDAELWNIGDDDEEDVYVTIYNKELGLNERIDVGDIDQFEDKRIFFDTIIPAGTDEGQYWLEIRVFDEDDDLFENDNDDEARKTIKVNVEGNCVITSSSAKITALLNDETPDAISGEEIIVDAAITNTGDEETTYTLSIFGNSGWSTVEEFTPKTVTLGQGESKDISIILALDKDAEGDKEFTIRADFDDKYVEQIGAFTIFESEAQYGALSDHLRDNWFIYVIVLINVILIIAIIAVIKRMTAPRVSAM
ncbi:putative S-layer protein [Candidatus Pacearchaeota archaeon]|nr:putative S-layer protein [Candidatus Pacearchaeota archaeon]